MATERPTLDLDNSNKPLDDSKRKEFKAKIASLLNRGLVVDRLNVELPPDVHGEWIRDDPVAIAEAKAMGFEVDTEYALKSALHHDGSGKPKVGDTIFMTIPKWAKQEIDAVKKEQYDNHHGKKGQKPAEEREYENKVRQTGAITSVNESKTTNAPISTLVT